MSSHSSSLPPSSLAAHSGLDQTITHLDHTIALRLKSLRKGLHLAALALDRDCGFGPGTIGRMERFEQRIYANHLFHICQATGVRMEYFYADKTSVPLNEASEKQMFLEYYLRIPNPVTKRDIYELVESMATENDCSDGS